MGADDKAGFSLIEVLIYCALSSFLVVLAMHVMVSFQHKVIAQQMAATYQATLYSGLDSFARICRQAPAWGTSWHDTGPTKISWSTDTDITEFLFDKKRLMHVVRVKDSFGKLGAPAYSVVLSDVEGSFTVDSNNGSVMAVHLVLNASRMGKGVHISKDVTLVAGQII